MKLEDVIDKISKDQKANGKLIEGYLEDFVPNQLLKSENLQHAFGISDQEMKGFYLEGYLAYKEGNYSRACKLFEGMVCLDPWMKKHWMGLAASLQLCKKYERALKSYAIVALLDFADPFPHFHAYECYMARKNPVEAKNAFQAAEERAAEYIGLKRKLEKIKEEKKWR